MLSHRSLFDAMWGQTEDEVTAQQVDALGPLPAEWWGKWEVRPKYFTQAGGTGDAGKPIEGRWVWSLDRTFEEHILSPRREKGMAVPDAKEREAFFAMVRCMLAFKPGDRPTAKELLDMEWMREWALPVCQKSGVLRY
jgi:hypothetical protein